MVEHLHLITLPEGAHSHLDKYWHLAQRFFDESDYALASFFAITLIEEVGKVIILAGKDISGVVNKRAFYDHRSKYVFAVGSTLEVNARVSRVYGTAEARFAKWFREGELFRIRNASLYIETDGVSVQLPSEAIARDDAHLLVCIAGEVYAEVQGFYTGTGPQEWERIIKQVDAFRLGHSTESSSA